MCVRRKKSLVGDRGEYWCLLPVMARWQDGCAGGRGARGARGVGGGHGSRRGEGGAAAGAAAAVDATRRHTARHLPTNHSVTPLSN